MNVRGSGWRKLAYGGARYGPTLWVKHSPTLFGATLACVLHRERAKIRDSLRLLCGPRGAVTEAIDIVRTFVSYAHCLTESLAAERPEAQAARAVVRGIEHLHAVIAQRRGAVMVTAHSGAWDVAARWLARDHSLDILLVMAREPDAGARALQDRLRERFGVRVAHVGEHPLDALHVLGHSAESSVEVELGGAPFRVPAGPFQLAKLAGVPIMPVFTRRLGYFRYEIVVEAPFFVPSGGGAETIREAAAKATSEMERFLSTSPTQWFHFSQ